MMPHNAAQSPVTFCWERRAPLFHNRAPTLSPVRGGMQASGALEVHPHPADDEFRQGRALELCERTVASAPVAAVRGASDERCAVRWHLRGNAMYLTMLVMANVCGQSEHVNYGQHALRKPVRRLSATSRIARVHESHLPYFVGRRTRSVRSMTSGASW